MGRWAGMRSVRRTVMGLETRIAEMRSVRWSVMGSEMRMVTLMLDR